MTNRMRVLRKRQWSKIGAGLLALVFAPAIIVLAAGGAHLEKTFDATSNPRISISNLTGRILVRGWDKSQVHAEYGTFSPRVEIDTEAFPSSGPVDKIHFTTHVLDPLVTGNDQAADYTLDVPVGSSVEIRNPQGSVRIEKLQADTAVDSVGGSITVVDSAGHLSVRSIGGNIELIHPSGRVEAYSITGNLHFVSPTTSKLRGNTTSGHIVYEGDFMDGGDYTLSAYSGDVEILCPASSSFELKAQTIRGKFDNALPLTPRKHAASPISSGNALLGTHNTGRATVDLTSFSGTIRIRPL